MANMGAELGATTSIFPSDAQTQAFLRAQGREADYVPYAADEDAIYEGCLEIDLSAIDPKIAKPHQPDHVCDVSEVAGLRVDQVAIGSCTNASYKDLMRVAQILRGKRVAEHVSLVIAPGSSNILKMLADNGALGDMIAAGARILEAACGPCIGMGQAPVSNGVSLRTFNRNFKGRCGTDSADVYLVSPETAAISAIYGYVTCPSVLENQMEVLEVQYPERYDVATGYFVEPNHSGEIIMGPNIKPFPLNEPAKDVIYGEVILKVGDHITTDDIVPSSAKLLPLRSNVPELSKHCFEGIDPDFYARAMQKGGGIIIGGENYGQGSSREHAALVPLQLGIKAVVAKSFARIHKANLINSGIVPFVFENASDYELLGSGDEIKLLMEGVLIKENGEAIKVRFDGSPKDAEIIKQGGLIHYLKAIRS
jgi:aconitate hydratase